MTEQDFERIERYLLGDLNSTEIAEFETRISSEPQLSSDVEEVREIIGAAKKAEIQNRVAKARQRDLLQRREAKVTKLSSRRVMSIAAGFLLIAAIGIGVTQQWRAQQPDQIASVFFEPAVGLPTTLGVTDNSSFLEGMIDYKLGDYSSAIVRWEKLMEESASSDTLSFYLGVAKLALDQPEEALEDFERLQPSSPMWSSGQWYTALAHIQRSEVNKAKPILKGLSQEPGTHRIQAGELLEKLK